jgi:SPX domain protein involved in polyphosphate accumulation
MDEYINIFKRIEAKYILSAGQYEELMKFLSEYVVPDEYFKSTICNLYFDSPDYSLIRRSLQNPVYKEKLRLRSYCVPDNGTESFIEIKKKYKGTVYKRRIEAPYKKANDYLIRNINTLEPSQILDEIDWFKQYYGNLQPQMFIGYKRLAYRGKYDESFRVTFDYDITYRDYDLDLSKGLYGEKLLSDKCVLMEIKFADAMPLWLAHEFDKLKIYKTTFSKYGAAYKNTLIAKREKGEIYCA